MKKQFILLSALSFVLFSCATTSNQAAQPEQRDKLNEVQDRLVRPETEEQDFDTAAPGSKKVGYEKVTVIPTVRFYGKGVKVEVEAMLLTSFTVFSDAQASAGYAGKLNSSSSSAQFNITLPAGHYECLVSEKAYDNAHAKFSVSIDGVSYTVYPSDPPLGSWELTTRVPVYFDVTAEKTIPVVISSSAAGMNLDYIQFVKIK